MALSQENESKLVNAGLTTAGLLFAYFVGRKWYRDWRAGKQDDKFLNDRAVQDAVLLNTALVGLGTDEKEVYLILRETPDIKALATIYKKKYSESLADALQGDLNSEEQRIALDIINRRMNGLPIVQDEEGKSIIDKTMMGISTQEITLFHSPDVGVSGTYALSPALIAVDFARKKITNAPANRILGSPTGKTYDNVYYRARFVMIRTPYFTNPKTGVKKRYYFWVSEAKVKFVTNDEAVKLARNKAVSLWNSSSASLFDEKKVYSST